MITENISIQKREYYQNHREVILERQTRYNESHREWTRENASRYRKENHNKSLQCVRNWYLGHITQVAERNKNWRKQNLEHCKEIERRYRLKNPEKRAISQARREAIKLGLPNTLTSEQWEAIKKIYHNRCAYCGHKPSKLTIDHVIPLSKGGGTTPDNIVPACFSCNSGKGNRPPKTIPVKRLMI